MKRIIGFLGMLACLCCAPELHAAYKALHSFAGGEGDGARPLGDLLLRDGCLYGMARNGGTFDDGVLFRVDLNGNYSILRHFGDPDKSDGTYPCGSLVASGDRLYGMAAGGGIHDKGLLFSCKTDGTDYCYMWDFGNIADDGSAPYGTPIIIGDTVYGMTAGGGANGKGVIFSIRSDGFHVSYRILHVFAGGPDDGTSPKGNLLSQGGLLFGMTERGGAYVWDAGAVFSMKPDGTDFTLLHSFSVDDGLLPQGSLASDGPTLYGMSQIVEGIHLMPRRGRAGRGAETALGKIFSLGPDGSGFTVLHSFAGGETDGGYPRGTPLVLDDTLYGTTVTGGRGGAGPGVVFSVKTDGSGFTLLHVFDGLMEGTGTQPCGGLVSDGEKLYGMTYRGGAHGAGVVFSLDIPAPSPTPASPVRLTLNRESLAAGDRLTADVDVESIAEPFDAWAVILGTDSSCSMVSGKPGEVRSGAHPLVTGVNGLTDAYSGRLLDLVIPPGAAGTYRVIVGLVPPGAAPTDVQSAIAGYADERTVVVQ